MTAEHEAVEREARTDREQRDDDTPDHGDERDIGNEHEQLLTPQSDDTSSAPHIGPKANVMTTTA